jgi:hypothetical protein
MTFAAALLVLTPITAESTPPDVNELVRKAIDREVRHQRQLSNYTWQERSVSHETDGKRQRRERLWDVFNVDGTSYRRLIERDGKPLSVDEARKEQEKLDKEIARRRNETESQRRKRIEAERKDREEGIRFREEVMRAFTFRIEGEEKIDGYTAWRVAGDPRPGFQPKSREGKILNKIRGHIWIEKQSNEWLKFDVVTLDKITFGGFLAAVQPGATMMARQMRVNDELWHPEWFRVTLNARALWKKVDAEVEQTFRNFRKFQTESRILEVSEVEKPR